MKAKHESNETDRSPAPGSAELLDRARCYRALRARDARFDGRMFVAVRTTGIYCRPICPARTPKLENVTFYASAAAAQEAGYRPCLRCRPESSPELAAWRGTSNTVSRAMMLIAEGALDGDEADVEGLAQRLGVGGRQLRRLFQQHLGASPVAVAQTRRVLFAKKLLHETALPMGEVAHAAGFGSVRRFNDAFQRLYQKPPSALRRTRAPSGVTAEGVGATPLTPIVLTLAYAPPYDWPAMLAFFAARAVPGLEVVEGERYARTLELDGVRGTFSVAPSTKKKHALSLTIRFPRVEALPAIVARVRRMLDLDADVRAIHAVLRADPLLAARVDARPGLRVPGTWDSFELTVRAILGQQITVAAARGLAAKLVATYGTPLEPQLAARGLTHAFPPPSRLQRDDLAVTLGIPGARGATLEACARLFADDARRFEPTRAHEEAIATLLALPGVGEWTAQYVALRALRDPDAFPASDLGLLRGAAVEGARPSPAALLARAEAWRPWRAYAAQHLWFIEPRVERFVEPDADVARAPARAERSPSTRRRASPADLLQARSR